jgi:hypothetical protein
MSLLAPIRLQSPYTNNNQHQSRQFHIHSHTPQPESLPILDNTFTHTQAFTALHTHHFIHLFFSSSCLRPSTTGLHQRSSPQTCIRRRPGHIRSHSNRCQSLVGKHSEHAISSSAPPLACDRCFNACTPCCTPLGNRKLLTVFTIRRYTPTPWALHPICPRAFPAGSGRRTHGAARRNAIWASSRATSSRRSMLATASGGWEGCDAIQEL